MKPAMSSKSLNKKPARQKPWWYQKTYENRPSKFLTPPMSTRRKFRQVTSISSQNNPKSKPPPNFLKDPPRLSEMTKIIV